MNEHVHTKQCGFDRNASHSAGHYVCACGFEDESAKRFEAPSFSPPAPHGPQGSWAANDPRRAFVDGAKWWEWTKSEATMWQHDIGLAEKEAEARFAPTDEPALLSEVTTNNELDAKIDAMHPRMKPSKED